MNTPTNPKTDVPAAKNKPADYNPNPFMIVISGVERLFKYAKPIAVTLLVISLLFAAFNWAFNPSAPVDRETDVSYEGSFEVVAGPLSSLDFVAMGVIALITLLFLAGFVTFVILIMGIVDFTAAAAANGRRVGLIDAFDGVSKQFWPYIKLRLLMFVKLFLWSLLFVVPGIYFTYRYYLAGVVFFSEDKRGNAAIKESMRLTKGAWLTTFASYGLLNIVTFGSLQLMLDGGTTTELYRNYRQTIDDGLEHPKSHWTSKLFVGLLAALIILTVLLIALVASAYFMNGGSELIETGGGLPVQSI
jgi:hypothetical protein